MIMSEPDFDYWAQYTEGFDAFSSVQNGANPASSSVQNESYPASSSVQNGAHPASSSVQNGSHPFPETSNQETPSTPSSVQKRPDVQTNTNNEAASEQNARGFPPQPWT